MRRLNRTRLRTKWTLGDSLTLQVPVIQATLGECDGPALAAAVSRAGALGCLTVHAPAEETLRRRLTRIRELTPRPVLIAFTCQWQRDAVHETCIDQGFRHFQVFWWNGPRLARMLKREGSTVFWQVGTPDQANEALENGADILVAQGTEAGGPVRSPYPLQELVTELRRITAGTVPIVAGGGLADAADVERVLSWGASAAMLGTRFLLSEEARAELRCKVRLLHATTDDLMIDPRIAGEWPCAPRRRLLTARDEDKPALFAGYGLSRMRTLLPASEIVRSLAPTDAL